MYDDFDDCCSLIGEAYLMKTAGEIDDDQFYDYADELVKEAKLSLHKAMRILSGKPKPMSEAIEDAYYAGKKKIGKKARGIRNAIGYRWYKNAPGLKSRAAAIGGGIKNKASSLGHWAGEKKNRILGALHHEEPSTMEKVKGHLQRNWGKYALGAGGAAALGGGAYALSRNS